jgi:hypothetical protein
MLAQCTAIFTQLGAAALLPDCDAMINPVTPQYPEVAWLWPTVFNTTELVNCTSLPFSDTNSTNTTDSITCPPYYTLNYDPDTNPLLPCFPECPAPVFFYDQVDNLYFILISFALLNLVIGPIVLIPHLFTRNRWKWPQQINIWIMIVQLTVPYSFSFPFMSPVAFSSNYILPPLSQLLASAYLGLLTVLTDCLIRLTGSVRVRAADTCGGQRLARPRVQGRQQNVGRRVRCPVRVPK